MVDSYNIGNALLILGIIYLHLAYGLEMIVTVLLVLLGAVTWAYAGFSDERKQKFKAEIEMLRAKAEYYRRKSGQ